MSTIPRFAALRHALRSKIQRAVIDAVDPCVNAAVDRAIAQTHNFEVRSRRDLLAAGERDAAVSSARLVHSSMRQATMLPNPTATLQYALSRSPAEGLALEFGVYSGTSLATIAEARGNGYVYGFDSFEGLPEHWRAGYPQGTFGADMLPEGAPTVPGAELVAGWFNETLPKFLEAHRDPIAFVHIDCDLYSSARTVLDNIAPRVGPGSIIVFDEYFNYPGWPDGEYRAWNEHVANNKWDFVYEAFTFDNEQVVVRVIDTGYSVAARCSNTSNGSVHPAPLDTIGAGH